MDIRSSLVKIGIAIEETWDFLHDVYADLRHYHQVNIFVRRTTNWPIFRERRNRALFQNDLSRFMRQNEVVFFEWASELLIAATQLPKTCGIVTRIHRYEMYKWMNQINWDKVDKIILVTNAKQKEFINRFPKQKNKTVVINESVSLEKFSFQPKPFGGDIGILCHLTPRKRVYELILDFYELIKKNKKFHLHIGGNPHSIYGDYMEAMRWVVKDLALESYVTFYGPVTDTRDWYHNIDIFISNSYSEGLQVALLEAMASGCFCLSHRWAGVDELLPQENLYYTGNELQKLILNFSEKSEGEKLALKKYMNQLVSTNCDAENISEQIRHVIEEVNTTMLS